MFGASSELASVMEFGFNWSVDISAARINRETIIKDLGSSLARCFRLGRHCSLQLNRKSNVLAAHTHITPTANHSTAMRLFVYLLTYFFSGSSKDNYTIKS